MTNIAFHNMKDKLPPYGATVLGVEVSPRYGPFDLQSYQVMYTWVEYIDGVETDNELEYQENQTAPENYKLELLLTPELRYEGSELWWTEESALEVFFEESFGKSQAVDMGPKDFTFDEAIDKARELSKPYKPSKKLKKKLLKAARKTIKEM